MEVLGDVHEVQHSEEQLHQDATSNADFEVDKENTAPHTPVDKPDVLDSNNTQFSEKPENPTQDDGATMTVAEESKETVPEPKEDADVKPSTEESPEPKPEESDARNVSASFDETQSMRTAESTATDVDNLVDEDLKTAEETSPKKELDTDSLNKSLSEFTSPTAEPKPAENISSPVVEPVMDADVQPEKKASTKTDTAETEKPVVESTENVDTKVEEAPNVPVGEENQVSEESPAKPEPQPSFLVQLIRRFCNIL